jgi:hypothetical protein
MSTNYIVATAHTIEYFSKGIDQQSPYMHVQYYIQNYSDTDRFINALMGAGSITGPITGGTVTRNTPHQHPLSTNLFCINAGLVQGLGNAVLNANGYPDFDGGALINAEYRPLSWDAITPDQNNSIDPTTSILYCTQEIDFSTETMTIFDHEFKFSAGTGLGSKTGVPAKFSIPITHLSLTFHDLPYMPMTAVRSLRGKVNTVQFLGSPPGTVLFRGCRTRRQFNSDGSVVQEVQMSFDERSSLHPWNSLPSKATLVWNPVTDDGTTGGNKMFEVGDLNPLVQF